MMLLAKALLVCCFTILAELSVIEGKEAIGLALSIGIWSHCCRWWAKAEHWWLRDWRDVWTAPPKMSCLHVMLHVQACRHRCWLLCRLICWGISQTAVFNTLVIYDNVIQQMMQFKESINNNVGNTLCWTKCRTLSLIIDQNLSNFTNDNKIHRTWL